MNVTENQFVGEALPVWAVAVLIVLHALTSLNGVLGSALILTALVRNRHFRLASCTYSVYLANLVLPDLYCHVYFFPALVAGLALGRYPMLNQAQCVVTGYAALTSYSVFLLTLTAISVDRYVNVCHADWHKRYASRWSSVLVCVGLWVLGAMVPLPAALTGSVGFDTKTHVCNITADAHFSASAPYVVVFVCSLACCTGLHLAIYRRFLASRRCVRQQYGTASVNVATGSVTITPGARAGRGVSASEMALVRSLAAIVLCFVLLVTPGSVARVLRAEVDVSATLYSFFVWLLSLNASVTWIVYGLLNSRFRLCYRHAITSCVPACHATANTNTAATTTAI